MRVGRVTDALHEMAVGDRLGIRGPYGQAYPIEKFRGREVLIVGGGPVGLTASLLLSRRGIENVVVERRSETQRAPAAHVLRSRPMQVFDELGVAREIRRSAPPLALDVIIDKDAQEVPVLGQIGGRAKGHSAAIA